MSSQNCQKCMILFALLSCSFLWSNQRIVTSMQAQQGPMTLEENFKLAKAFPEPSSWLLSNACAGCHGTNGAEMDTEIPPIAGMDKNAFIAAMKAYKAENPSKATVMTIVAEPLTDKEIESMASYFSKQKAIEWTQKDWHKDVKPPAWIQQGVEHEKEK